MFISYYFNRQMWAHIFFNLLVAELECTHRVCVCEVFLWCGTLYILNVLAVTEQMFRVALRECVY